MGGRRASALPRAGARRRPGAGLFAGLGRWPVSGIYGPVRGGYDARALGRVPGRRGLAVAPGYIWIGRSIVTDDDWNFGGAARRGLWAAVAVVFGLALAACEGGKTPEELERGSNDYSPRTSKPASIFGEEGVTLFGGKKSQPQGQSGGGIGVNSFLWRASLDTISFMPVNAADPFGGVIITDWYSPPETPVERFKLNVYIIGRTLRADGIRVAVFRQLRETGREWRDAAIDDKVGPKIEDAILTRARQLRNQTLRN